jgi:hypothetical protein
MRNTVLLVCASLALIAAAPGAQVYSDSFNYANGTNVPGWNESVGDWSIQNGELACEHKFLWQYLVLDQFSEMNACVQMTVIATPSTVYYQDGGGTLRYSTLANVMCKIQDNNRNGDFDICYVYDRPGSATSKSFTPNTKRATVRLYTLDKDVVSEVDADMDGVWDLTVVHQTAQVPAAGKPGIHGLGGVFFDDFKYFNAVTRIHANSQPPAPGSLVTLQLKGPANQLYQCACSFSNRGFPLDPGRRIPLDVDNLLFLSVQNPVLFQSFSSRLDGNGDGLAGIQLPKIPALSGLAIYFAMVVLDANAPNFIGNISNDTQIRIQ